MLQSILKCWLVCGCVRLCSSFRRTLHFHVKPRLVLEQIDIIENSKNDSRRMFKAVDAIKSKAGGTLKVCNRNGETLNSRQQQIEAISEHFKTVFSPSDAEPFPDIPPQRLKIPFTQQEITTAIKAPIVTIPS